MAYHIIIAVKFSVQKLMSIGRYFECILFGSFACARDLIAIVYTAQTMLRDGGIFVYQTVFCGEYNSKKKS